MKQPFTLLLLSGAFLLDTKAQLVLNSNEMMWYGSSMVQKEVQYLSDIDTTVQGANVTWDFTGLQANPSVADFLLSIADPADTPYGSSFPGANYAYVEGPTTAYRYFALKSDKMERLGSGPSNPLKVYDDTQIEYVFSMQLGSSSMDTWNNNYSSTGGTYNLTCVGTGTLKLPGGGVYDALMVRVDLDESFYAFKAFFWYGADNGAILVFRIFGDGFFVGNSGKYTSSLDVVTSVDDRQVPDYHFSYTNPVVNYFNLSLVTNQSGLINYEVVNMLGQTLMSGRNEVRPNIPQKIKLDFSSLTQGIYLFDIKDENGQHVKSIKLIKE